MERSSDGRSSTPAATLDLVGASALWGGMYVVSAGTFDHVPPLTLGVLRLVVGVAVLGLVFRGRFGFRRSLVPRVVGAGTVVAITLVLQFVGTSLTGGAEGALLTTTTPAFVLVLGVLLEGQRVHVRAWLGVAIALAGVAVIASRNASSTEVLGQHGSIAGLPAGLVGDVLLVGSAATWALFSSVGRPLVAAVGAFRAILQASVVAIAILAPLAPFEIGARAWPPIEPVTIAAVAYLGIGATAVAWSLWYRGYAAAPSTLSAAAFFAQPVVGAALGVALLGEQLGPAFVIGAVFIAAGVLAIASAGRHVTAITTPGSEET
jgi:drug/metabolite transporter (DMT)-like permease